MASFLSSVAHQTSLMRTATAQSRRMAAVCICFLLLAGGSSAHSQELKSCRKKELVVYVHRDEGTVTAASPSGNDTIEFGTLTVIDSVLRKGSANESTPLGYARGLLIIEKDLSISGAFTYEFTTPDCTGSLAAQGTVDPDGNGELAITGGTGTYRWAQGYVDTQLLPADSPNPVYVVYKDTIHLKYF